MWNIYRELEQVWDKFTYLQGYLLPVLTCAENGQQLYEFTCTQGSYVTCSDLHKKDEQVYSKFTCLQGYLS